YYLGSAPSGDVRLTIADEKGTTVRTLTGTKGAGLNRVWWDLRGPASESGGRGAAAAQGGGGGGRGAATPLVAPGTYTIKLSVDGQELTSRLSVRKDPIAVGEN